MRSPRACRSHVLFNVLSWRNDIIVQTEFYFSVEEHHAKCDVKSEEVMALLINAGHTDSYAEFFCDSERVCLPLMLPI